MRVASLIAASVLGLLSLGLLAAGGGLLWADSKKDEEGYISTGFDPFATDTRALATEDLDIDATGVGWLIDDDRYGKVRLRAQSQDGKAVFVGIARTRDAARYLSGVHHDLVTDLEYDPFRADYREQAGSRRPGAPGDQRFWAASAQGAGTQTLTWDVEHGNWSVVVMNADASPNVDVKVRAGAEVPFLEPAGWGALIAGLVALGFAGLLTFLGLRSPRRETVAA
ncbi:MAG: hypothetical protein ACXW08_15840 [Solirubrobacteraceae bacterium]